MHKENENDISINKIDQAYVNLQQDIAHSNKVNKDNENDVNNASLLTDTVLIVNPNSKGGLTGKNWNILFKTLSESFGKNVEVAFTKKSGDGTLLTREFLRKGFKHIIPIGGDGMINEVANGFFEETNNLDYNFINIDKNNLHNQKFKNTVNNDPDKSNNNVYPTPFLHLKPVNIDAVMTVLPCGTRNVLVKSLDLPPDLEKCCKILSLSKTTKRIDVISAIVTDPNDKSKFIHRIFLNAAEIGIGAKVIEKSKKIRKKINNRFLSTLLGIFSTVSTFKGSVCNISINSDEEGVKSGTYKNLITKMTMCVIANGKFLGGGFQGAPKASVEDGLLDVVIIKDSDGINMIDELISMNVGDFSNQKDDIFYSQAKNVIIKSNKAKNTDISITVDGEPIGNLPAFFQVSSNLLTIRV